MTHAKQTVAASDWAVANETLEKVLTWHVCERSLVFGQTGSSEPMQPPTICNVHTPQRHANVVPCTVSYITYSC
jgi:hypothetical protein